MTTEPASAPEDRPSRFGLLLTVSAISSLIMLDTNVVAVSLPTIGRALHADFVDLQWVIGAYVLSYAALLLAAGSVADLRGRRAAMLAGLAIFAVASGACGLATTTLVLNLSRAFQGVGGALLLTASMAIITREFSGAARAAAFSVWGASIGIALAAGPIIGGVVTSLFGWRWIFIMNVPLGAALILATAMTVPESRNPDAKTLDVAGIVSFSLGLAALIWALIDGNDAGWASTTIVLRLVASAICIASFVVVERGGRSTMVDVGLFRQRTFLGSVAAMIGYGASAQVMVFFLPQMLQNAYRLTPLMAGFGMIPFALPMVLAPRVAGPLARRFSGRDLLTAGLLVSMIGNLLFWLTSLTNQPYVSFAVSMIVAGCGAGLLNGETVAVIGMAVPPDRAGMASGIASTTRYLGILISVAGLGAVLSRQMLQTFSSLATGAALPEETLAMIAKQITAGDATGALAAVPPELRSQLDAAGHAAFAAGFSAAALVAAIVGVITCALTFWLVDQAETAPATQPAPAARSCATVDCRHPI